MNIVITGAHPDDPESSCGGFAIQAVRQGHRVYFAYMTSGYLDRHYGSRPVFEVREEEARAACAFIGVEPRFLRLQDADVQYNHDTLERTRTFLDAMNPDVVLTHWPLDSHPDHQVTGVLVTQAVFNRPEIALIYYEVQMGAQSFAFEPNRFIEVTDVADLKRKATDCHVSQDVNEWWHYHDLAERVRGAQIRVPRAEGYLLAFPHAAAETLFGKRPAMNAT
jgi:LmbE family N-acetylglucosaminyl deacetylase